MWKRMVGSPLCNCKRIEFTHSNRFLATNSHAQPWQVLRISQSCKNSVRQVHRNRPNLNLDDTKMAQASINTNHVCGQGCGQRLAARQTCKAQLLPPDSPAISTKKAFS